MRQLLKVVLVVAALVVAVFFLTASRVTKVEPLDTGDASLRFRAAYARFDDAVPMLSRDASGNLIRRSRRQDALIPIVPVDLTVLAWRGPEVGLVEMRIPLWFLRLQDRPLRYLFRRTGLDPVAWQLEVEPIQDWGPGIIIDHRGRGERVLAWVE